MREWWICTIVVGDEYKWIVGDQFENKATMVEDVRVIERSALTALEAKLAVAVRALKTLKYAPGEVEVTYFGKKSVVQMCDIARDALEKLGENEE